MARRAARSFLMPDHATQPSSPAVGSSTNRASATSSSSSFQETVVMMSNQASITKMGRVTSATRGAVQCPRERAHPVSASPSTSTASMATQVSCQLASPVQATDQSWGKRFPGRAKPSQQAQTARTIAAPVRPAPSRGCARVDIVGAGRCIDGAAMQGGCARSLCG